MRRKKANPFFAINVAIGVLAVVAVAAIVLYQSQPGRSVPDSSAIGAPELEKRAAKYDSSPESLKNALAVLKKLQARIEIGVNRAQYAEAIGQAWGEIKVFVDSPDGQRFPEFSQCCVGMIELHKLALSKWEFDGPTFDKQDAWMAAEEQVKLADGLVSGDAVWTLDKIEKNRRSAKNRKRIVGTDPDWTRSAK